MVAFPDAYTTYRDLLTLGVCVAVKGKLNIRNDEPSILIDKLKHLGGTDAAQAAAAQPEAAAVDS